MAEHSDFRQGPNAVHPEQPSAVGSRDSLNRDGRDEYSEARLIIDEEVDKIINHIGAKLPPEALQDIAVTGNIKGHLHNYFNQTSQNLLNRFLTTAEDELGKKIRGMVDKEEHIALNRYTPREVSALLNQVGGPELFNTGEVEKSLVNIMGHLQGHVQRGAYEFENFTTDILSQHTDVGGFIRGQNAYSVVKCSFRDDEKKFGQVVGIKLALNILDEELISPILHHQLPAEFLIKEVVGNHIQTLIDKEVDEINGQLKLENRPELTPHERLFEKIKAIENYTDDGGDDNSKRYQLLPRKILEAVEGISGEMDKVDFDVLNVREGVAHMLEDEGIRSRGWHTAVNALTGILDNARMGYQHVENYKHSRRMLIREYEETDVTRLPDERFQIELRYLDAKQIQAMKVAYAAQLVEFRREILRLWEVVEQVYMEEKTRTNDLDWDDLVGATIYRNQPDAKRGWFRGGLNESDEARERQWNEITFVQRKQTSLEEMNQTYEQVIVEYSQRLLLARKKLSETFEMAFPDHRLVIEERLNFLEDRFREFTSQINPFHLQPGLLLDVDVISITRRRVTIRGVANVLGEFLTGVSTGFIDSSLAHFTKRRSHVGDDNADAFGE